MEVKILRDDREYLDALREAEVLVNLDPEMGSNDAERLELLTLLIEDFEKKNHSFHKPDPIAAIKFRMEEEGLRQRDLVPLIGSRSRVSEILSGKRSLTVRMIRNLSEGLGIPADTLINKTKRNSSSTKIVKSYNQTEAPNFPIKEMKLRGWLDQFYENNESFNEALTAFLKAADIETNRDRIYFRKKFRGTNISSKAYLSTLAWTARVRIKAKEIASSLPHYDPCKISLDTLISLGKLSAEENGPRKAIHFLEKLGIVLIIEPKLPKTLIDGAAMLLNNGVAVIGLTLRYDRIDYFWFTLLHEMAHIWRHINTSDDTFIDRIDVEERDKIEKEANRIAREAFIPAAIWKRSEAYLMPSRKHIKKLATELNIHPAIAAGRLQYETGKYEIFRDLLGEGTVRNLFIDSGF